MKYLYAIIGYIIIGSLLGWLIVRAQHAQVQHIDMIEVNFRAACDAVKGQTVWNGRNWECLK